MTANRPRRTYCGGQIQDRAAGHAARRRRTTTQDGNFKCET